MQFFNGFKSRKQREHEISEPILVKDYSKPSSTPPKFVRVPFNIGNKDSEQPLSSETNSSTISTHDELQVLSGLLAEIRSIKLRKVNQATSSALNNAQAEVVNGAELKVSAPTDITVVNKQPANNKEQLIVSPLLDETKLVQLSKVVKKEAPEELRARLQHRRAKMNEN